MNVFGLIELILSINIIKTIWFNLKAFPFKVAIKIPVIIKSNVEIWNVGEIHLTEVKRGMVIIGGDNIKGYGKVRFLNKGKIFVNCGKVIICRGCILENYGDIIFEGSVFISENTKLLIREKLVVGENVRIGFNSCIMDSNDHFLVDMDTLTISSMTEPIVIGSWCWLGCYTFVKKGTVLPNYIIVAAPFAVLCKDYSKMRPGTIVAGSPAKQVKETNLRIIFNSENEDIVRKCFFGNRNVTTVKISLFTNEIDNFL